MEEDVVASKAAMDAWAEIVATEVLGEGVTEMAPGSQQGLQMVVTDAAAARAELLERGEGWASATLRLTVEADRGRGEHSLESKSTEAVVFLCSYIYRHFFEVYVSIFFLTQINY